MRKIKWTSKMDSVLGTDTDKKVAALLGLGVTSIRKRRSALGISSGYGIKWTSEVEALLGTMPDKKVAARFGVSMQSVNTHRRKLNIPAFGPNAPIKWTEKEDLLLGSMPDWDVAVLLDIWPEAVRARRGKLGISAFGRNAGIVLSPEAETQLGLKTDKDLAAELGISRGVLRRRRHELGIPSWSEQNRVLPKGISVYSKEAGWFYKTRRKHRKLGLVNTLTYEQWKYACKYFNHRCAYCGVKTFLTEDHLVPVSKGGPRTALNIIPCCASCNSQKRAKQAHLWICWKFGMREGKEIIERIVAYLTEVKYGSRT